MDLFKKAWAYIFHAVWYVDKSEKGSLNRKLLFFCKQS